MADRPELERLGGRQYGIAVVSASTLAPRMLPITDTLSGPEYTSNPRIS